MLKKDERDEMILILHLRTGWNQRVFEKMTDDELQKTFNERA